MALDQQRLGGLMLNMLEQLEDAVLVVSVGETEGPRGRSGIHWASTCRTFHSQLGLMEVGRTVMVRAMNDTDMRGE